MMRQPGEITQVRNGMLQITFCRPEACAACNACEGGKKEHVLWVKGEGRLGDIAVVEMPEQTVAKASFLAYGLPLVTMLSGMVLGSILGNGGDAGTAIGAAAGLGVGALVLGLTEKKRKGRPEWSPKLVEVLENADTMTIKDGTKI